MTDPFEHALIVRDLVPLVFAALVGCGIGLAYLVVHRGEPEGIRIANACMMLTVVICLITRVVDDLATAFIVVGALTLVRLRAAIEDTREFGFLLLAVAAGLGAGERRYEIVVIGAVLVCLLALVLTPRASPELRHRLSLTLPDASVDDARAAIASTGSDYSLRLRGAGEGLTNVRTDFVGVPGVADSLLEKLRVLPDVQDLRYETKLSGEG